MLENKQYTNVGDALQACCRRFESAIAHDSVVNWKSVFYGFPFHYFLLLALLVFVLPVKQTPIDWSPVKHMMEAASEGYDKAREEFDEFAHDAQVRYRYTRIEAKKLKKQLMEQGEDLKEDARKALLEQLEKLEAALTKDEDTAVREEA